ncbi:MAG: hypothetical protein JSV86_17015 [Gemmatimonadota bacterium]|nr:MAG: hypothetical protein JSV86_17015 [Gemmatimonadota bacterium]
MSIYPQADRVNVMLDGHTHVPAFLERPNVRVIRNEARTGSEQKFRCADEVEGYHVYADDDLIYPPNYVERIIEAIEFYERRAVVGVLGAVFRLPLTSYVKGRIPLTLPMPLADDAPVHVLGTGTMAHHTDTIRFRLCDYPISNMADIWSGIKAKRSGVAMIAIARPAHWVKTLRVTGFTVSGTAQIKGVLTDAVMTRAVLAEPWEALPYPKTSPMPPDGWTYDWIDP